METALVTLRMPVFPVNQITTFVKLLSNEVGSVENKALFHLEQNSFVFTSKHLALQAVLKKKVLLGRTRPPEMCRKHPRATALSLPRFCSEPSGKSCMECVQCSTISLSEVQKRLSRFLDLFLWEFGVGCDVKIRRQK